MGLPLHPDHTNRMTCADCAWTRIIDHTRHYRGGHTHPEAGVECHGMLVMEEVDVRPPDPAWFEIEELFTPPWQPEEDPED